MKLTFKKTKTKMNAPKEPKSKKKKIVERDFISAPISARYVPLDIPIIERYPLKEPFVHAIIGEDPIRKTALYLIDELKLNDEEVKI